MAPEVGQRGACGRCHHGQARPRRRLSRFGW